MNNFDQIPQILKSHRKYMGMTQKEVGKELNIPYQDYQKYEHGIHIPKIGRYKEICEILSIPDNNIIYHLKDYNQEPKTSKIYLF